VSPVVRALAKASGRRPLTISRRVHRHLAETRGGRSVV